MPALGAGCRVDHAVDQRRALGCERSLQCLGQARLVLRVVSNAAERLDHFVVAGVRLQAGRGWWKQTRLVAAINPAVIEDHNDDRKSVAADSLDLHTAEAEGAVTLDSYDGLAAYGSGGNGIAHADAHHAPGTDIEAPARLPHVNNVAREVECVGPFVDDINVPLVGKHITNRAERDREIHGMRIGAQLSRHAMLVLLLVLLERLDPLGAR